ncbi:MAG: restriction endonuclease [Burkholderiales bacterium]|nr:MAG: restriction endonuclease [Burkholderiales bacterium]
MSNRSNASKSRNSNDPLWGRVLLAVFLGGIAFLTLNWSTGNQFAHLPWWQSIAGIAQYVVPLLFLLCALLWRTSGDSDGVGAARPRRASKQQAAVQGEATSMGPISKMQWGQFEMLVVEAFRRRGFRVTERGTAASDGSMNLELASGEHRFVAHCKQWRAREVGMSALRELNSIMVVSHAAGGFVVTSGGFSREAAAYATGRNIQLIDGPTLREMLRDPETQAGSGGSYNGVPTVMPTGVPTAVGVGAKIQLA